MSMFTLFYRLLIVTMLFFILILGYSHTKATKTNLENQIAEQNLFILDLIQTNNSLMTQHKNQEYTKINEKLTDMEHKLRFLNAQFVAISIHTKITQEECRAR